MYIVHCTLYNNHLILQRHVTKHIFIIQDGGQHRLKIPNIKTLRMLSSALLLSSNLALLNISSAWILESDYQIKFFFDKE